MATNELSAHFGADNPTGTTTTYLGGDALGDPSDPNQLPKKKRKPAVVGGVPVPSWSDDKGSYDIDAKGGYFGALDKIQGEAEKTAKIIPEPVDRTGQRIYGNSQFAGGNDPNGNTRVYPNLPMGGYFMTNDEIAQANKYGDNAGVWMASGGGLMGRGTAAQMNATRGAIGGYGTKLGQIMAEAKEKNAVTPELQTTADKFRFLLKQLQERGG